VNEVGVAEHDPALFFQIAAALIPALIFGGLISAKLKPRDASFGSWTTLAAVGVVVAAQVVLLAEVFAITVSLNSVGWT